MSRKIEGYMGNYEEELNEVEKQLGRSLTKEEEQIVGEMANTNYDPDEIVEVISRGITVEEYEDELEKEKNKNMKLAVAKQLNVEVGGEIVCDVMYTIWTGTSTLEQEVEWNIGVKLNKEQAAEAQKTNLSNGMGGTTEFLTEGYYICTMDRGGEHYYKMDSEEDVIMGSLKIYEFILEQE